MNTFIHESPSNLLFEYGNSQSNGAIDSEKLCSEPEGIVKLFPPIKSCIKNNKLRETIIPIKNYNRLRNHGISPYQSTEQMKKIFWRL